MSLAAAPPLNTPTQPKVIYEELPGLRGIDSFTSGPVTNCIASSESIDSAGYIERLCSSILRHTCDDILPRT